MMFEESFPTNGYIDCLDFLKPLANPGWNIDLGSLGKLRTMVETVRRLTNFFMSIKDGIYPNLKKMSAPVLSFPEVQRRIDVILDKYGDVKDTASDNLLQIRRSLKSKEGAISKRANAILKQAQADGIVDDDAGLSVRDGKLLIPVNSSSKLQDLAIGKHHFDAHDVLAHYAMADCACAAGVCNCHASHLGALISGVHGETEPIILFQLLQKLHESDAAFQNSYHVFIIYLYDAVETLHGDNDAFDHRSAAACQACTASTDQKRYIVSVSVLDD